jgi:hypothetical protein
MENPAATCAGSNVIPAGYAALTENGKHRPDASAGLAAQNIAALGKSRPLGPLTVALTPRRR